jgi:hypothetical protein
MAITGRFFLPLLGELLFASVRIQPSAWMVVISTVFTGSMRLLRWFPTPYSPSPLRPWLPRYPLKQHLFGAVLADQSAQRRDRCERFAVAEFGSRPLVNEVFTPLLSKRDGCPGRLRSQALLRNPDVLLQPLPAAELASWNDPRLLR